eukprot:Seg840.5 transcript_id=Seg840.5/GoldUCD/mRNA.D3Y31 product="hypothetical protein" protein_id=Seg840.5/GoldUCD/D3Y31
MNSSLSSSFKNPSLNSKLSLKKQNKDGRRKFIFHKLGNSLDKVQVEVNIKNEEQVQKTNIVSDSELLLIHDDDDIKAESTTRDDLSKTARQKKITKPNAKQRQQRLSFCNNKQSSPQVAVVTPINGSAAITKQHSRESFRRPKAWPRESWKDNTIRNSASNVISIDLATENRSNGNNLNEKGGVSMNDELQIIHDVTERQKAPFLIEDLFGDEENFEDKSIFDEEDIALFGPPLRRNDSESREEIPPDVHKDQTSSIHKTSKRVEIGSDNITTESDSLRRNQSERKGPYENLLGVTPENAPLQKIEDDLSRVNDAVYSSMVLICDKLESIPTCYLDQLPKIYIGDIRRQLSLR